MRSKGGTQFENIEKMLIVKCVREHKIRAGWLSAR